MPERLYLQGNKQRVDESFFPRKLLFDANVWLSIGGPFPDHVAPRATAYSKFYKSAAESGCEIIIPQLVAAEFVNKTVWMQAKAASHSFGQGKLHDAKDYGAWIKEGCDLLHSFLSDNVAISDSFQEMDMESIYSVAEQGGLEFHDVLLVELCQRHDAVLVTDDADFSGQEISIISWNQRLS